MIDKAFLEKMFAAGFHDGIEKTAGGLQSLGRAIFKLRELAKAGKIGSQASRLAGLEAKLEARIGAKGMEAFNKGGVAALRGEKAAAVKGAPKGRGTLAASRKSSRAAYQSSKAQEGVSSQAYTATKQTKGKKAPRISNEAMQQARQGQRAAYAEGMQTAGVQPMALPGAGAMPAGPAYVAPRMAPVGMPAAGVKNPATAAGINQQVAGRAQRVRQNRANRFGGGQGQGFWGGMWQGVQNTVQQPGFWPAAGIGAAAGAGAVGLGAALGS